MLLLAWVSMIANQTTCTLVLSREEGSVFIVWRKPTSLHSFSTWLSEPAPAYLYWMRSYTFGDDGSILCRVCEHVLVKFKFTEGKHAGPSQGIEKCVG